MKLREKIIWTTAIFLAFFAVIYLSRPILTPFICAMVLAYFFNPLVQGFQRQYKGSRTRAVSLILGIFSLIFIGAGLLVVPIIYNQALDFANSLPDYYQTFVNDFYPRISALMNKLGFPVDKNFANLVKNEEVTQKIIAISKDFISNAISSSSILIDIASLIFILPILLFYFLKDWNVMIDKINEYLPSSSASEIQKIIHDIDKAMSGYISGQFNVCLILAVIYAALLSFTGLNFGFLIGFITGMLIFIPYIGMLIGFIAAMILAIFQWGFEFENIGIVIGVFLFGQVIESNFLTPKLVGSKIGLHPLWLIFGLFFFGVTLGFTGVLLAVPLTAISGVLLRRLALAYKQRFV